MSARDLLRGFVRCERGSTSILALYFTMIFLVLGGLAVDFMKLMQMRTKLQITADSVAHAALYTRDSGSEGEARTAALAVAEEMLPNSIHGGALQDADISFGTWDHDTATFTADNSAKTAVRVDASRLAERSNALPNLILRMIGFDTFDIARTAVFTTYNPPCFREGFVAQGRVDLQSNNSFTNGFCIHSNDHVSVNQNNTFEPGTVVSMPDSDDIDLPQSGYEKNDGLQAALRDGAYRLRIINRIEEMVASLSAGEDEYKPSYISGALPIAMSSKKVDPSMFTPGRHHKLSCTGNKATFEAGTYEGIMVTTDCQLTMANGAVFIDSVIATSSTSSTSVTSPSGMQLGRDDDCAAGGGAILVTLGGVSVAANMQIFGSQILAKGDVSFAANADGIEGASIISGGEIDGTSNASMGFCGENMDVYEANYFRLAL